MAGEPYVAIDRDSSLVLCERANGHRVFYGDARRPVVPRAVGAADADLVIVTVDDFEATENIVAALHEAYPDVTILARGARCRPVPDAAKNWCENRCIGNARSKPRAGARSSDPRRQ
ncbi:MAG: NAD-binding protein [Gammaproteobacteria bacterium]|nr:NAD-binding protein [Gammaproteobacteria bacterium]MDH3373664.1 NAD-binding protein [Gammaproteobacteria bacterium]MDH3410099.1 NAD-binding protein [Gammaproteobacteria bacterium]